MIHPTSSPCGEPPIAIAARSAPPSVATRRLMPAAGGTAARWLVGGRHPSAQSRLAPTQPACKHSRSNRQRRRERRPPRGSRVQRRSRRAPSVRSADAVGTGLLPLSGRAGPAGFGRGRLHAVTGGKLLYALAQILHCLLHHTPPAGSLVFAQARRNADRCPGDHVGV